MPASKTSTMCTDKSWLTLRRNLMGRPRTSRTSTMGTSPSWLMLVKRELLLLPRKLMANLMKRRRYKRRRSTSWITRPPNWSKTSRSKTQRIASYPTTLPALTKTGSTSSGIAKIDSILKTGRPNNQRKEERRNNSVPPPRLPVSDSISPRHAKPAVNPPAINANTSQRLLEATAAGNSISHKLAAVAVTDAQHNSHAILLSRKHHLHRATTVDPPEHTIEQELKGFRNKVTEMDIYYQNPTWYAKVCGKKDYFFIRDDVMLCDFKLLELVVFC